MSSVGVPANEDTILGTLHIRGSISAMKMMSRATIDVETGWASHNV